MRIIICLFILMTSTSTFASIQVTNDAPSRIMGESSNIDSCFSWVRGKKGPGVSPLCSPAVVSEESARSTINNNPVLRKINNIWYLFVPYQIRNNYETLWFSMSNIISALEASGQGTEDLFLIKTPETREEINAVKSDTIIESLYIGQAKKVVVPKAEKLLNQKIIFPRMHYESVYQLVIW